MNPIQVIRERPTVLTLRFLEVAAGWEQWFLLRADAHHDNLFCDQDLERQHLREAKDKNALIVDIGDLFCAMQGKWDKRADQKQMRDELRGNDYLDQLVEYCADFYSPFASYFLLLGLGNHETAILKHHQTNLTERLAERLKLARNVDWPLSTGGFSGWIRLVFDHPVHGVRDGKKIKYHHGYGGGGPVTRDVIQTNRKAVYLPDADFVISGHTHDEFTVPIARDRLSTAGVPYQDRQWHIKIPGYKNEYSDGEGGFHIEKGRPPKPIGAMWLRLWLENHKIRSNVISAD